MDKENQSFFAGIFIGLLIACAIVLCAGVFKWKSENEGYENKLVIKYHNPNKEYDREMVLKMVNDTQVWTNFVIKEMKMNKHRVEYRMTNPKKD